MKVYDILAENKQVDEGPVRFLKRTLGKNTAMGKAAQLDVELDKEVDNIYKDFVAVSKQRPDQGGMTAKGLANFLVAKGFASKPIEVMGFINQDKSLSRTIAGALGRTYRKGKKLAKKAYGGVKGALTPKKTDLTPDGDDRQLELPLANGMYTETMLETILNEVDIELNKSQIKQVIKGFVRKGFQKQLGSRVKKSAYGDNLDGSQGTTDSGVVGSKPKAGVKRSGGKKKSGSDMMPPMDVQTALEVLQKNGYVLDPATGTLTPKGSKKKSPKYDPADVNKDGKVSDDEKSRANYKSNYDRIFRKNK